MLCFRATNIQNNREAFDLYLAFVRSKFKLLGSVQTICGLHATASCQPALASATYRDLGACS